ncbi:MAG: metal ABC transporter permease [Pseudomonadota bacterium]
MDLLFDHTLRNAALGAALLGVVSGVIGSFALLRRQSLIGDTLSHATLPGICLGFLIAGGRALGPILLGAVVFGVLAGLAVLALVRATRLKTDAALGIALSLFFALGVVLLTYVQGQAGAAQAGLESFLFGQAAAVLTSDLAVLAPIAAVTLGLTALFWKEFKLASFDPVFARTIGLPVTALETLMTLMVAIAVVIGLQMVGVVLMAAMIIAPAAAARQWSRTLEQMVVLAALIGLASGVIGALLSSTGQGFSTGPLIVLVATGITVVSILVAPGRGVLWQVMQRHHERQQIDAEEVLATFRHLIYEHGDPTYPVERGMLNTYHGRGVSRVIEDLTAQGLIAQASHMDSEGDHWVLTPKGLERSGVADA